MNDSQDKLSQLEEEIQNARNNLSADRLDMSFGEIISTYEREELIINPNFQRLFRWSNEQQTKFIESLILGIPVPPIFVAEVADGKDEGKWELVDGLQRVSTVLSFFGALKNLPDKNNWSLGEGKLVKAWKGNQLKDIHLKYQLNIRRSVCRIEILRWNRHSIDMRYELFTRLNTLGTSLSEQELRNCIFRPQSDKFSDLLKKLANKKELEDLVEPTEGQQEQLYLEELVLRFFAFYDTIKNKPHAEIKDSVSSYLDHYMDRVTKDNSFNYQWAELFHRSIKLLAPLGRDVFRGGKERKRGPFSTSCYDVITVGVALNIDCYEKLSQNDLQKKLEEAKQHKDFKKIVSSQQRVAKRIEFIKEFFVKQ